MTRMILGSWPTALIKNQTEWTARLEKYGHNDQAMNRQPIGRLWKI
jgi:hypothetical protein